MIYINGDTFIKFNKFSYATIDFKDQFDLYTKGMLIKFSLKKYSRRRSIIKFVFDKVKEDDKPLISLESIFYSLKEKMNLECIPTYNKYFVFIKTKKFAVKLRKNSDIIFVHFKESKALYYFSIRIYIPKEWQINFLKYMIRRYLK